MKPIYLMLCLSFSLLLTLCGCTKENEVNPNEIPLIELPSEAALYLQSIYPGQEPLLVEKAGLEEKDYSYKATYPDKVTICFNEKGKWQQIGLDGGVIPEGISGLYEKMVSYINSAYKDNRIVGITRTNYGQFATLDNKKKIAFSEDVYFGEELGAEGYNELPETIQSFLAEHFPGVGCKYVAIDWQASETSVYKYRVSLNTDHKVWFDRNKNWKLITSLSNDTDTSLPLELMNILPEKIRKDVGAITKLVTIYKHDDTLYDIATSRTSKKTYTTIETPPTDLHQKEVKEFIDAYFESGSSYGLTVPIHSAQPVYYHVSLPNGFDFRLDDSLAWSLIDGHGFPFTDKLLALVPEKILSDSRVKKYITAIRRDKSGYYITLRTPYYLQYDPDGNYIGQFPPTAYERAYALVRYMYPKDFDVKYRSWEGLVFQLNDGTKLVFDEEGNLMD